MADTSKNLAEAIGRRMRTIRKDRGLTQNEAADLAGIAGPTWNKIERGTGASNLGLHTLIAVADALGVSVAALISDNPDVLPPELDIDPGSKSMGDLVSILSALSEGEREDLLRVLRALARESRP